MTTKPSAGRIGYARLLAPIVMVLFVVGWYEFSVVYIQGADNQLVANGNLAVYVPVQQVQGYLSALLYATYLAAAAGSIAFVHHASKFLRARSPT
ncbi:MAG TPA: hypothetical protein VLY65_00615 [Nitrososphaerales archaeon]|nr:hypothetical protein [Nitrososphaerales archaeon]